jgi:hypothetical protein
MIKEVTADLDMDFSPIPEGGIIFLDSQLKKKNRKQRI